jgi:endonuclease/exonuclease/phosphatase (EEP) superfamily protein YafD
VLSPSKVYVSRYDLKVNDKYSMILNKLLLFLSIAITILTLGKFIFWIFPLELLTHFQVHYFWLTILLIIICQCQRIRNKITLLILLFALTINSLDLATWYSQKDLLSADKTNTLKVMSFNIKIENTYLDRIVNSIKSADPDLALLIEIDVATTKKVEAMIIDKFPYHFRSPGGDLAVFSKLPLEGSSGDKFLGSNDTHLVTHLKYRDKRIKIIGVHPFVPIKSSTLTRRNLQLDALANHLQREQSPTILMGDFNLSPWSPYYRKFIDKTKLHNTRYGFGILPSWIRPSTYVKLPHLLLPVLNIPIDHIFISKDFKVVNTYIGDNGNSDHAPIISELTM